MKIACLMPGQGAQEVGMGRALAEAHAEARRRFDEAERVLPGLRRTMWEGPEEALARTEATQPALYLHSCAAVDVLAARGIRPAVAAGHSVGEYAALYAAGAISFEDGLRLVAARAEAMGRAARARPGGMAAILGLADADVEAICREAAAAGVVVPANWNAPGQVVISGETPALERAVARARGRGGKAVHLRVAGPWHSPLMEPAAAEIAPRIAAAAISAPAVPVIANVSAEAVVTASDVRSALVRQVAGAVRWADSMRRMIAMGIDLFVEVGTGTVLKGLLKRIDRKARSVAFGAPADLDGLLAATGARAA